MQPVLSVNDFKIFLGTAKLEGLLGRIFFLFFEVINKLETELGRQ